ncbi:MAG: hypothetical protein M5U31_03775 [Acidimicrobiia bacterium]|nr:hypothetical protein [Acidimicrobiia bacterium]
MSTPSFTGLRIESAPHDPVAVWCSTDPHNLNVLSRALLTRDGHTSVQQYGDTGRSAVESLSGRRTVRGAGGCRLPGDGDPAMHLRGQVGAQLRSRCRQRRRP